MLENIAHYKVVLASKSPRRKQLLEELGLQFEVKTLEVEEVYPEDMPIEAIPAYLADLKAQPFENELNEDTLVITADTIVCCDHHVLGKPANYNDAYRMLKLLSGRVHQVATGVCIMTKQKRETFTVTSNVYFKEFTHEEIHHYISNFKPYDKAGAYGIQEWIGYIGVERIEGSYFNVMGLPVQRLYEVLSNF
jgi:septum formation protein